MKNETTKFDYQGQEVEFLPVIKNDSVMVNATSMGKNFGKTVEHFTRLDNTKNFIDECLKNPNMGYLNIKSKDDLINSRQKSGTYMHRILALKFAAWLNPAFELWVFSTIDQILFGKLAERKNVLIEKYNIENQFGQLEEILAEQNEQYKHLVELQSKRKTLLSQLKLSDKEITTPTLFDNKPIIESTSN